ncbi:MAG: substrate-binding domain-containing protein [Anaerolineae bacterium]|nr:substrate-binding domain-containing protein [Anaerolineae bacterium]
MIENLLHHNQKNPTSPNHRPTIGYLAASMAGDIGHAIWSGVVNAAQKNEVNLICFPGDRLCNPNGFLAQANVLYDLVDPESLDGLISWTSTIGAYVDHRTYTEFYQRYRSLPMVSLGTALAGVSSVLVDGYCGMREMVIHLIEHHGYRRLAFIQGPEDHPYAQERYQAFIDTLAEYDLPLDPDLITPPADWAQTTGYQTIQLLLNQRGLQPQVDFQAVVAASDRIALGALEALQMAGVRVPDEMAVVGFNNSLEGQTLTLPLTSVAAPFHEQGEKALELILAMLAGGPTPEEVILPSRLVVRRSCGCLDAAVAHTASRPVAGILPEGDFTAEAFDLALTAQRETMITEMVLAVSELSEMPEYTLETALTRSLLDAFTTELLDGTPGVFLQTLDEVLRQAMVTSEAVSEVAGRNVMAWQEVVSVLRHHLLPYLGRGEVRSRAEDLWQQARLMISETAQRAEAYQTLRAAQRTQRLREIGQALITTFDVTELMDILARELPQLGIECCYLSLYQNPAEPTGLSCLTLAYDETGRIEPNPDKRRFPSHRLAPEGMLSGDKQHSFVVEPLYFHENQLGFVLFQIGPQEGMVYEALRGEISSALPGALLVEKRRQAEEIMAHWVAELELVSQVSAAALVMLDTTELLQQVTNLIKDRFELYHAHIYLFDQATEMLVLAAGAGTVGAQMVAEGWRIPLKREQSLVAQAARMRQPVIANQVTANPNWLPNRLLPDTQSELAVPLVAGDRLWGVLDVQADEVDRFAADDTRIQSIMAAQITVALENARLFEQSQANMIFTERLYQAGVRIAAANNLPEVVAAVAEAVPAGNINRVILFEFEYNVRNELEAMVARANWHSGRGIPPTPVETRYHQRMFSGIRQFIGTEPLIFADIQQDERFDERSQALFRQLQIRAMAALPLWTGARQIGVLLLQTDEAYQLSETEIQPYASLMGQVAVAVQNQRLLAETNAILAEMEAVQRRYRVQSWEAYRAQQTAQHYERIREGISADGKLLASQLAAANGQQQRPDEQQPVEIDPDQMPSSLTRSLTIRDRVIGWLGLQETYQRNWSPHEIALVEAISEQVARAYENLRLIDETQQRAARESRISEIGDRIRSAQSLEEALQIAVREIGHSLEAPQTVVKLEVSDS